MERALVPACERINYSYWKQLPDQGLFYRLQFLALAQTKAGIENSASGSCIAVVAQDAAISKWLIDHAPIV